MFKPILYMGVSYHELLQIMSSLLDEYGIDDRIVIHGDEIDVGANVTVKKVRDDYVIERKSHGY